MNIKSDAPVNPDAALAGERDRLPKPTLAYPFEHPPEPGTALLIGLGLAGLAAEQSGVSRGFAGGAASSGGASAGR